MHITVVTVTYGNRWGFLQQTLQGAFDEGADNAIVIDNASSEAVAPHVARSFSGKALTLRLESNAGSAGGYHEGIQAAIANGASFILLLDDDNYLEPGSLSLLKKAFQSLLEKEALDRLCVLGFRPDQMPEIVRGFPQHTIGTSGNTFFGFHVKELPIKVCRRLLTRYRTTRDQKVPLPEKPMRLRTAPFGGMLFHRSLIERYGYPDPRLVLYVDDTEFSYRISSRGGSLWLIPKARIRDLETSWQVSARNITAFESWLCLGSDKHVYYTARNWAYFQSHCRQHSWPLRVNRQVFLAILWLVARSRRKTDRLNLLISAISEGEKGLLGVNPAFPPGA
jgi:GT2 family glycosyltransferase